MNKPLIVILLFSFSLLFSSCLRNINNNVRQDDISDGVDSLIVFYSDIVQLGTKYGFGDGYGIILDHEEHPAVEMIKSGSVSRMKIYDKEDIESFAEIVFDRSDYDTLTWHAPSIYQFNDEVYAKIPGGYRDGVDCVMAVLAFSKNIVDTISIGDYSRVQLNNLSFDDDEVYKYILKLVSENDSTWAKNNDILYYDNQYHHYAEALGHIQSR